MLKLVYTRVNKLLFNTKRLDVFYNLILQTTGQEQMNKNLLFLLEEEIFAPASFGERKGRKC